MGDVTISQRQILEQWVTNSYPRYDNQNIVDW